MEFLQTVNVQATNDVDIGRKVRAIKRIAAEPIEGNGQPPEAGGPKDRADAPADEMLAPPDVPPEPEPGPAYFIVGKGEAKPGEIATVELLGTVDRPVVGIGGYIGCPPVLELVSSKVSDELGDLLGLLGIQAGFAQNSGGGIEGYIAFHLLFMGPIKIDPGTTAEDAAAERKRLGPGPIEARLPPLTVLAELKLRVPENATPGTQYALDNTDLKYGRRFKSGFGGSRTLKIATVYGTSKEVSRYGISPILVSGWIDVI